MSATTLRIGSLFSGAGGLDLAALRVFGGRIAWHCELEWLEDKKGKFRPNAAVKVLEHRFPGVPNLGDISAADWATVEQIDILIGGFPCQDVSAAGLRAGIADGTRSGLWAIFAKAIAALRPRIVVIENVRGLLSAEAHRGVESDDPAVGDGPDGPVLRAAGAVVGDLADLGYDAQWVTVSAASVGAPHERFRVFILAVDANAARDGWDERWSESARFIRGLDAAIGGDGDASDAEGCGRRCVDGRAGCAATCGGRERVAGGSAGGAPAPVELLPTPKTVNRASRKAMTQQHWSAPGLEQALEIARGELPREFETWDEVPGRSQPAVLLPTPCASRSGNNQSPSPGAAVRPSLDSIAHLLPTPTARDGKGAANSPGRLRDGRLRTAGDDTLPDRVVRDLLPTPAAADGDRRPDFARANRDGSGGDDLVTMVARATREIGTRWGKYEPAIRRWERLTRPAPSPTEPNTKGEPRLAPPFPEWMMGWPPGWVTAVPGVSRNDQLRLIGNGVCPQQAVSALQQLLSFVAFEVAA